MNEQGIALDVPSMFALKRLFAGSTLWGSDSAHSREGRGREGGGLIHTDSSFKYEFTHIVPPYVSLRYIRDNYLA